MVADDAPNPAALVGLLAEDARLRVVAALALGTAKPDDLLAVSGLSGRDLGLALRRLEKGGLVTIADGQVMLNAEVFKASARAAAPEEEPEDHGAADPREAAVLRTFVRGGRLLQMPVVAGKRRIVLEHIAAVFEPGVRYAEREVNAILRAWFDDYAALRRYLVDGGLLAREAGEYWRIGGWVADIPPAPAPPAPALPETRVSRLAAHALLRDGDAVLLTRIAAGRRLPGAWHLPGGMVEFGETPAEAVVREVREETGLSVRLTALLTADSQVTEYDRDGRHVVQHNVALVYEAEITGGALGVIEVDGSTDAVQWWPVDEVAALPTTQVVRTTLGL